MRKWLRNALVTPFVVVRVVLYTVVLIGQGAEWLIDELPGWKR